MEGIGRAETCAVEDFGDFVCPAEVDFVESVDCGGQCEIFAVSVDGGGKPAIGVDVCPPRGVADKAVRYVGKRAEYVVAADDDCGTAVFECGEDCVAAFCLGYEKRNLYAAADFIGQAGADAKILKK